MAVDPGEDKVDDLRLLFRSERYAEGNVPPLVQASAATGSGRVLGQKDGVSAHGRLAAVVRRTGGREALAHEVLGVAAQRVRPLVQHVAAVGFRQAKAASERGSGQLCEGLVKGHIV